LRCNLKFVAGKVISNNELQVLNIKLQRNGYLPLDVNSNKTYSEGRFNLSPLLNYEPNINGGNPAKNLVVGDLYFVSDPKYFKVGGFTAGASLSMNFRHAVDNGQIFDVKSTLSFQKAIDFPEFSIQQHNLSVCLKKQIVSWNITQICNESEFNTKALTSTRMKKTKIGHQFYSDNGDKVLMNGVEFVLENGGYDFSRIKLKRHIVDFNGSGFAAEASWGESRELSQVKDRTLDLKTSIDTKYLTELALIYNYADLEPLLGIKRIDERLVISTKISLSRALAFRLGYEKVDSTIDYFDIEQPFAMFDVRF
jgi:hypothetical protein